MMAMSLGFHIDEIFRIEDIIVLILIIETIQKHALSDDLSFDFFLLKLS